MGKIKIKDIEGDAQEINHLLKENGFDLPSYLGARKTTGKVKTPVLFSLVSVFFVLNCCVWNKVLPGPWSNVAIQACFFVGFIIVAVCSYNYRSKTLLCIIIFAVVTILSLTLNVYSPKEIAKKIETLTVDKYNK